MDAARAPARWIRPRDGGLHQGKARWGSTADWAARATGPRIGAWAGWLVFLYCLTNFVIQVVAVGLFFNELLLTLSIILPKGTGFTMGVLLECAWPAWMVYRGLSISAKGALAFLLVEILTVTALCVTVVWVAPRHGTPVTFDGFSLSAATQNRSGMFHALIFAMLGFCGFDVVSTLAEETRTARKLIPRATILALLLYAILMIGGMWALTLGGDAARLRAVADSGRMPINDVAQTVWGRGPILVTLTALTATLGLIIATSVGASRILFAKGRRATAPVSFSRLHTRFQVPWQALHAVFAVGIVGTFVASALIGAYDAYVWWINTSTFFAMLTFLFGNLAAIILNWHRVRSSTSGLIFYLLVPAIGIAADVYILVQSFFIELWAQPWSTGKSEIVFDVACAVAAVFFVLVRKPARADIAHA